MPSGRAGSPWPLAGWQMVKGCFLIRLRLFAVAVRKNCGPRSRRACQTLRVPLPDDMVHVDTKKLGRILKCGQRVTDDRVSRRPSGKLCAAWPGHIPHPVG